MTDPLRFAVLDIGSNTVRLLVAEPCDDGFIILHSEQIITRLGERRHETGLLGDDAISRTLDAIDTLIKEVEKFRPVSIAAVATHAARNAGNVEEFKKRFSERFSFDLDVIDWEMEATLSLNGAAMVVGRSEPILLFDIGGGSTEFIYRGGNGSVKSVGSSLGVVRLSETFISKAPLIEEENAKLAENLSGEVEKLKNQLGVSGTFTLVGTAGTVTAIAAIHYDIKEYDPKLINNRLITKGDVTALLKRIGALTIKERGAIAILENGREDLIIPGMAIIIAVMDAFQKESLTVSDSGLREGLLMALIDGSFKGALI